MFRITQILFFLATSVFLAHIIWVEINESQLPAKRFAQLWQKDLDYLSTLKGFPKWNEINGASFVSGNHLARSLLLQVDLPKQLNQLQLRNKIGSQTDGITSSNFDLEIVVVSWKDAKETGLVVQYELTDSKTKNKKWEFSRTLIF